MSDQEKTKLNIASYPGYPVAVITPVGRSEGKYLEELAHSVLGLSVLLGNPIEWVLALDGLNQADTKDQILAVFKEHGGAY